MSINLIFKIAAVGILVTVISQVLKHSGREEHAFLTSLAGLLIVLFWIVPYIYDDAREYWRSQRTKQYDILEQIEKQMRERRERETITIKKKKTSKRWVSHLDEIGELEDE